AGGREGRSGDREVHHGHAEESRVRAEAVVECGDVDRGPKTEDRGPNFTKTGGRDEITGPVRRERAARVINGGTESPAGDQRLAPALARAAAPAGRHARRARAAGSASGGR